MVLKYPFTGGPTWVGGQNAFYFSNYPPNATGATTTGNIIKYTPGGTCEVAFSDVGTVGLAVTPEGRLIGASYKTRSISDYDLGNGYRKTIIDMALGLTLDIPIDVVVHDNGTIYFTNRSAYAGGPTRLAPGVYRFDPLGAVSNVAGGACCPFMDGMGGVALAPGDKTLYVTAGGSWDLDTSGAPLASHQNIVGDKHAGGVAVDCDGNVYLAESGEIRNASLQPIAPLIGATNLRFGGADGMTLLLLNNQAVVTIQTNVPGMP
jgi:sugar lactone lactonase YvrE